MDPLVIAQQGAQDLAAALQRSRVGTNENVFTALLGRLAEIQFSGQDADHCSPEQARIGLTETEAAIRRLQSLMIGFVTRLDAGRDAIASVKRATGVSTATARDLTTAAVVAENFPGAATLLATGEVSVDHLRSLGSLPTELIDDALILEASTQSADQFRKTVAQHRVKLQSTSLSEEQRATRSVTFFKKRNGCVGATIVLPPIEGTEFVTTLNELCDQAWATAHPERASVIGGHNDEPREQRLADALVTWMRAKTLKLGKPAVIITIDATSLDAEIVPNQPIPLSDAIVTMARADVYAAIRDGTNDVNLRFGRNKRVATPLQRLAMLIGQPTCVYPGCATSGTRSQAHHLIEYEHGGRTDIGELAYLCQPHHQHLHQHHQTLRYISGTWTITNDTVNNTPAQAA